MKSFVFCICMGYNGKCRLFSFMLEIILLRHKVGLCLHGLIYIRKMKAYFVCNKSSLSTLSFVSLRSPENDSSL